MAGLLTRKVELAPELRSPLSSLLSTCSWQFGNCFHLQDLDIRNKIVFIELNYFGV